MARPAPDYGNGRGSAEANETIQAVREKGADSSLADALAPQLSMDTGDEQVAKVAPGLADKFIVPPFTVLDTRAGYWQERRRAWLSLGMRGETTAEQSYSPNGSRRPPSGGSVDAGGGPAPLKAALGTTEAEHRMDGTAAAQGSSAPSAQRETYDGLGVGGRRSGMVYAADAPGGDPSFYDQKAAVEARLGRTLTTAEFQRDHYAGRADKGDSQSVATGTSVFDPVLCEIAYRWFSPEGGLVVDPFAGGVVRGLLAGILGRQYVGVELRPEQIADNRTQADRLLGGDLSFGRQPLRPVWMEGDATQIGGYGMDPADLIFTCPPYADLEVYSDNPADLSTMAYPKFREALFSVMEQTAGILKPDRFAVWVVGEARDKRSGNEYGFVPDTIMAARAAGLGLHNSAILVNSVGSAALRAQRIIRNRKLTRVHQHVLVFVKGDGKRAAAACGNAEVEV